LVVSKVEGAVVKTKRKDAMLRMSERGCNLNLVSQFEGQVQRGKDTHYPAPEDVDVNKGAGKNVESRWHAVIDWGPRSS
jgi:hypothetical protein